MAVSSSNTYRSDARRPRYFDRQQLRAVDLTLEQQYLSERLRQFNSHLHGWGVVCGAFLTNAGAESTLEEGFAIAPLGQTMLIPEITALDLLELVKSSPCCADGTDCEEAITNPADGSRPETRASSVYLVARPAVLQGEPRTGVPEDCGHPGNHLEYSRICDAISLHIVCALPPLHEPASPDCNLLRQLFCRDTRVRNHADLLRSVQSCPPQISEEENYVVLARLQLMVNPTNGQKFIANVGYEERRVLLSTQLLQHYLSCLCTPVAPTASPTPSPTFSPTFSPLPTATIIPTATFTLMPTVQPTFTFMPTATIMPTFTFMPTATIMPTFTFMPTATIVPTFFPTGPGGVLNPGGLQTQPVPLIPNLDILEFDTVRGRETSIDELTVLDDTNRARLREAGVDTVLGLYAAETSTLAEELGLSEIQVAEYKDNALEKMKRAEPLVLDAQAFDIGKGVSMSVEELNSIGPERGKTLRNSGYGSVADVANASPEALSKATSVSEVQAEKLIKDARSRLRIQ